MGASVLNQMDVCRRLARFKSSLKRPLRRLHFASVDLSKCFDRIDHEGLLRIVEPIICETDYRLIRYLLCQCDAIPKDVNAKCVPTLVLLAHALGQALDY